MSAELGSVQAVFDRLDAEQAAKTVASRARRDRVTHALDAIAWAAEGEPAWQAWRAVLLEVPDGEGWPEAGEVP